MPEALDDLLPRIASLQEGLEQWHELVGRLTANGHQLDPDSTRFVLWAMRSLARNLVAIDDQVEALLGSAPEIPRSSVPVTRLELVSPGRGA